MSALDESIRAIVRAELRALGVAPAVYTSLDLPPGVTSREHFAAACRKIPSARRSGKVWSVDAASWADRLRPRASASVPSRDDEATARASGLRVVGRRA